MASVLKPSWWGKFATYYGFTDDVATTIDSDVIKTTLDTYVLNVLPSVSSSGFLASFTNVLRPTSTSKMPESLSYVPETSVVEIVLGYGGNDFLSGTAGDNILVGGTGNDYFSGSAGIDFVIGSDESTVLFEEDTIAYLRATSGIVVELTDGGVSVNTGLLPNQDVYKFSYADYLDSFVPRIEGFQMGSNGDYLDISALLSAVGYTGSNPVADGYISVANSTDSIKVYFDPDGLGAQVKKEFVRLLGHTTASFNPSNLLLSPIATYTGDENNLTYVSNDGNGAYDFLYSVENIYGSNFDDVISGHTVLSNIIFGGLGNDVLSGEGGHDTLIGGDGHDTIYGGSGMDLILIGHGGDQLYGGADQDAFKFDTTNGLNIAENTVDILDFETGVNGDKIDVSEILSYAGYAGIDAVADGYVQIVQDGANLKIDLDLDGIGVNAAQTIAVLHNTNIADFSVASQLVTSAPKTLYISALGQSNAAGLSVLGEDEESGLSHIRDGLVVTTDYNSVILDEMDENGRIVMPAIGSTRVNGDYGGKPSDSWWYPSTNTPGEILIRAVEILSVQIAEARASGVVKPVIVWGQGEGDSVFIGGQTTEAARLAAQDVYMNATLAVFDYIRSHVGDDVEFYIMETGRYIVQAGLNAGNSQATIDRTVNGLPYIRSAQEQMALMREDIHIATKYTDLPMYYDIDPVNFSTDSWHFHPETREIIGDRVAEFISLDMGYTHILNNPGDYPLAMLDDLDLKDHAGMMIYGNANNNIVVGTLGNDILTGGAGNDALYGGAGADEVHYVGLFTQYTLSLSGSWVIITDNVYGQGTDTLIQIEKIVFADGYYESGGFVSTSGTNNAPIAQDDNFVGNQDTNITGNLLSDNGNGVDSDPDFGALSVIAGIYATAHGSVTISADGGFTYTPNAGYFGGDTFDYTLSDNLAATDIGTVNLTVNEVVVLPNINPVAQDDVFNGTQNVAVTGNLLVNNGNGVDSDADLDTLSVVAGTYATVHGSVTISADGNFTYTPTVGYSGSDVFEYTLSDGRGGTDVGSVSITLAPVTAIYGTAANNTIYGTVGDDTIYALEGNDTVYGESGNDFIYGGIGNDTLKGRDGNDTLYGDDGVDYLEGGNGNDVLIGGVGADSLKGSSGVDTFTFTSLLDAGDTIQDFVASSGEKIDITGILQNVAGFQAANAFTEGYLRVAQSGVNTLVYVDVDGTIGTGVETFLATLQNVTASTLTLNAFILPTNVPANTPPVSADDVFIADQDTPITGNLLVNNGSGIDSDVDGHVLSVFAGTYATVHGSVTISVNGDFVYTPTTAYFGSDAFDYILQDGFGGSDTGTVFITLNEVVNTPPVAVDDVFTANQDTVINGNLLVDNGNGVDSDANGHALSVLEGTYATLHGSVAVSSNGDFVYSPEFGYFGSDSFDYTLADTHGGSDIGTVSITLNNVNTAPVAADDVFTADQDIVINGNLLLDNGNGVDSDANDHALSVFEGTYATLHGSVSVSSNGDFVYTPEAGYFGFDSFDYILQDSLGGLDTGYVSITLNRINNAPIAQNDNANTDEDTSVIINVLSNDSDIDLDPLQVSILAAAAHGSLSVNGDGTISYTPYANYNGLDSFSYGISDGYGGTASATVSIIVSAINDNPLAIDDQFTGVQDSVISGNLLANNGFGVDSDLDTDVLSVLSGTYATAHGSVTVSSDGSFLYAPTTGYFGADTFDYTLQDGQGGFDVGTVNLTLTSAGIVGTAGNDSISGTTGNDAIYGMNGNDTLKGRDGDDTLYGGDGIDYLEGGNGNDILIGGLGADNLKGSSGIDTFVFQSMADAGDTIQDFRATSGEKLDISDLLIGYDPLTHAITDYVEITDNGVNSFLAVDIDGGANNFVQIATLLAVIGLTNEESLETAGTLITV